MEKKDGLNITVFEKEHYDRVFNTFKSIPRDTQPEEVNRQIINEISAVLIAGQPFSDEITDAVKFYRIRVQKDEKPVKEEDSKEFTYPPIENCSLGRANLKGQQVLYTSGDPNTPFYELGSKEKLEGLIVYLSTWRIKRLPKTKYYRNFFVGVEAGKEEYASLISEELNKQLEKMHEAIPQKQRECYLYCQKKYTELFTTPGEEYYHISSALVQESFSDKRELDIPAVAYPSVAKSNAAINFVFRKDFVDEYMELEEIRKLRVLKMDEDKIETNLLATGRVMGEHVIWSVKVVKDFKTHPEDSLLILAEPENKINKVSEFDFLTFCCDQHKVNIEELLLRAKLTDEILVNAIRKAPVQFNDFNNIEKVKRQIIVPYDGELIAYKSDNTKAKVTGVIIPVEYEIVNQDL